VDQAVPAQVPRPRAHRVTRAGLPTPALIVLLALGSFACRGGIFGDAPRFAVVAPDVAIDRTTNLEWTTRDHDEALPWDTAARWCDTLVLGEHDDWRLPEVGELTALYDPERDEPCGDRRCRVDSLFLLRGPYVWTATERGAGARFYVDLAYGNAFSPTVVPKLVRRVLCVRGAVTGPTGPT
jgi:hypothetical protein